MDSRESLWAVAPYDILALVLEKLPSIHDYLHFSLTSKSWLDVAREERQRWIAISRSRLQLPLLLIPEKDERCQSEEGCGLYDIINKKKLDFQLSMTYNNRCAGSSHGWLFFSSKYYLTMVNPFSNRTILLPAVKLEYDEYETDDESLDEEFYSYHVKKAILSCDPLLYPENFEVLVTYGGSYELAIYRARDKDWTYIENHIQIKGFRDVIYHKGAFYAIDFCMGLGKIEASTTTKTNKQGNGESDSLIRSYKIDMIAPRLVPIDVLCRYFYLAESSKGDLVFIMRRLRENKHYEDLATFDFKVYKLIKVTQSDPYLSWIEVDTLGGDALFLGDNHSMAISANKITGYQKNSIYYTDDSGTNFIWNDPHGPRDMGIFNLEEQRFDSHYTVDPSKVYMPVWIVPSLGRELIYTITN